MILSRILLIPVIAAVGYEILRWGARHRANPIVKVIMWPGILVQMITTKQPTDDMIEVAIVSMEEALRADGEDLPAASGVLERDPMVLPGGGAAGLPVPVAAEAESAAPVTIDPPSPGHERRDGPADGLDARLADVAASTMTFRPSSPDRRLPRTSPRSGRWGASWPAWSRSWPRSEALLDGSARGASPGLASCATRETATRSCTRWPPTRSHA